MLELYTGEVLSSGSSRQRSPSPPPPPPLEQHHSAGIKRSASPGKFDLKKFMGEHGIRDLGGSGHSGGRRSEDGKDGEYEGGDETDSLCLNDLNDDKTDLVQTPDYYNNTGDVSVVASNFVKRTGEKLRKLAVTKRIFIEISENEEKSLLALNRLLDCGFVVHKKTRVQNYFTEYNYTLHRA